VVIGAAIEYDGMTCEVVASGIRGGRRGSSSTTGAGAGAVFGLLFFTFFGFFPPMPAPTTPAQQHSNAARSTHCQRNMKEPEEPDAFIPELGPDWKESADESFLKELLYKESREVPEPDEAEESHGVTVVVTVAPHTGKAAQVVAVTQSPFLTVSIVVLTAALAVSAALAAVHDPTQFSTQVAYVVNAVHFAVGAATNSAAWSVPHFRPTVVSHA